MLDMKYGSWSITDRNTGNQLQFSLFDERIMVRVQSKDRGQKPLFFKKMTFIHVYAFKKVLDKVMAGSPENKISIKIQTFDRMNKQWRLDWVLTVEKDSKMCCRFHLTDATTNQTFVFGLMGPKDMTIGSDVMSDGDRSAMMVADLKEWLTEARHWAPALKQPFDPNKARGGNGGGYRGGNGGGWKGNGGGYNGGGAAAQAPAPAAAPAEEDNGGLPF